MTEPAPLTPRTPRACSIARTLELIGEKWTILVIREVLLGVRRFDEIQRQTGAPRDILSNRLRKLVEAGILERRQYQEHPARSEYRLTTRGYELRPVLLTLHDWGERHLSGDTKPYTWRHRCGEVFQPQLTCAACGEPVTRGRDLSLDPAAEEAPSAVG